jgi:hypothetical protein
MTPGEAIHSFCVQCVASPYDVKECGGNKCGNGGCDSAGVCGFFKYRLGKGRPSVRLIRRLCLFCQGGRADFLRECTTSSCSLNLFRMGRNPHRAGMGGNTLKNSTVSGGLAVQVQFSGVGVCDSSYS